MRRPGAPGFVATTPALSLSPPASSPPSPRALPLRPSLPRRRLRVTAAFPPIALRRRRRRPCPSPPLCSGASPADWNDTPPDWTAPQPSSPARIARSLWHFSRPHTVYGTFLSVVSLTAVAVITSHLSLRPVFLPFLAAVTPALLLNVYIVGLNQVYDIPIDQINKPTLPLASGAMTLFDAWAVIIISLISGLSFCFVPIATLPLRVVLIGSVLLGTAYSAPPLRLKRFPLLASISILSVRGLLINLGFFLHAKIASGSIIPSALTATPLSSGVLPPVILFATLFFMVFGIVIALLKDVPDIKGDRLFGIRTFSVRVGASSIFRACVFMLATIFVAAGIFYYLNARTFLGKVLSLLLHVTTAVYLTVRARSVDTNSSKSITDYYMLSWKAFYLEYLFLPFAAL